MLNYLIRLRDNEGYEFDEEISSLMSMFPGEDTRTPRLHAEYPPHVIDPRSVWFQVSFPTKKLFGLYAHVAAAADDWAYRIGQTKTLNVHYLTCRGTIDKRIYQLVMTKGDMANYFVDYGSRKNLVKFLIS